MCETTPKRANPVKVSSPSDLLSQVARREGRRGEEKVVVTWRDVTSSSCGGTHAGKGGVERRTKLCRVGTTKGRHTRPERKERESVRVFLKEVLLGTPVTFEGSCGHCLVIPVILESRRPVIMSTAVSESSMTMSQSMDSVSTITEEEGNLLGGWRVTVKRAREPSQTVSGAEMESSLKDTQAQLAQRAQKRAFLASEHKQRIFSKTNVMDTFCICELRNLSDVN
ncbi:hypothetical protein NPIL_223281 [Nephila pilipes]|uniref:Uncharacterized protein n=1 Tax=Nephila pilipes TaxID=299642 RepID=A0A8X6MH46_NEPPI|nr:hypothetical protein NPIL_223281 [Nephila pilipes]